jgi:PAS domain S-box-containing protein
MAEPILPPPVPLDGPQAALIAALRADQERLQAILSSSLDVVYRRNIRTGRYDYLSPVVEQLTGFSYAEITAFSVADFLARIHPEDRAAVEADLERTLKGGSALLTYRFLHHDGHYRWLSDRIRVVLDATGDPQWRVGTIRDLTGRKRLRDALRESERRYRELVETAPIAGLVVRDGRFLFANPAALRLCGAESLAQLQGHTLFGLLAPEDRDAVTARLEEVLAGKHLPAQEARLLRLDGRAVPLAMIAGAVEYQGARAVQLMLLDVTERKQAEERLAAQEALLRAIVDQAADGITVRDTTGRLLFANAAAQGFARGPTAGTPLREAPALWGETFDPDGTPLPVETWPISRALQGETLRGVEWQRVLPDGTRRVVLNSAAPLRNSTGAIFGAVSITTDISERKRGEEALRRAKEELEERVLERTAELAQFVQALKEEVAQRQAGEARLRTQSGQLRALAAELTLAEQRERQRLALVLHDGLQQLLVGVKFRVSLLERMEDAAVRDACRDLHRLLDESIAASRSLAGELTPPILKMAGLVPAFEWLAAWMKEKHGLTVTVNATTSAGPATEALQLLLFQSVRELLFNVVKHAHVDHARIDVQQQRDGDLAIQVCDEGVGFAAAVGPAPLSPEGFGLFSIQERLQFLGGQMTIDSAPGEGCRITLSAPVRPRLPSGHRSRPEPLHETLHTERVPPPAGRLLRLLVVDDHPVMREGLVRLLVGSAPELEIVGEAADGQAAIEAVRQLQPDVVLMDVNMIGMTGIEATRRILAEHPHVQVIAFSMYDAGGQAEAAMKEAGAVAYVSKGGPSADLLRAIRACTGQAARLSP